jgi:hypothetical protein
MKNKSYALICCYFGKWPVWIELFCESVLRNQQADVLLYSDCGPLPNQEKWTNVKVIPYTFQQAVADTRAILKMPLEGLVHVRQVCNIKPLYGTMFKDDIKDYPFWGYIDIDLFYGNIEEFVTKEDLENYDIISAAHTIASGHFCIYRNIERINILYSQIAYLEEYLNGPGLSLGEMVMGGHITTHTYLKNIRYRFRETIYDDRSYRSRGRKDIDVLVDKKNGIVSAPLLKEKFQYIHFQDLKNDAKFFENIEELKQNDYMLITNGHIYASNSKSAFNGILFKHFLKDLKWLLTFHFKKAIGIKPFRYE